MSNLFLEFIDFLSLKRKKQLIGLLFIILLNSFAEMVSLAAIIPFLIIISDPSKLIENNYVRLIAVFLGFDLSQELILPITILFIFTVILAGLIRLINLWISGRLSVAIGTDISNEIYKRILYQDYSYHLEHKSSEIISILSTYISRSIAVIRTIFNLITSVFISLGIVISLFFIDWKVAITSISLFGILYLLLAFLVRSLLIKNSQKVADSCDKQIGLLQDSLGSIRDIILETNQNIYLSIFQKIDNSFRLKANQSQFLGAFPKYLFEIIGFCIIALLAFVLITKNEAGFLIIPVLGAFALGAQKLLPSFQQIYAGWSTVNSSLTELKIVMQMLNQPVANTSLPLVKFPKISKISFNDVTFKYFSQSKYVLKKLNFAINSGEMIALIGGTGTGKSTLTDLLMGLLSPSKGNIVINDNLELHDFKFPGRINSWRSQISHVPQSIFISDSSIIENIAFGVPKEQIDINKVKLVSKQSQLYDFINDSGFDYKVGERGCNLSGGQIQRIGIARALYKDCPILILDEATSALDKETEKKIMNQLSKLKKNKTIIIISHNKLPLKYCDKIFEVFDGEIIENFKKFD